MKNRIENPFLGAVNRFLTRPLTGRDLVIERRQVVKERGQRVDLEGKVISMVTPEIKTRYNLRLV